MIIKIRSQHHRLVRGLEIQKQSHKGMRGDCVVAKGSLPASPNSGPSSHVTVLFLVALTQLAQFLSRFADKPFRTGCAPVEMPVQEPAASSHSAQLSYRVSLTHSF